MNFDPAVQEIFQGTPSALTESVVAFCASLNPHSEPTFLKPVPFRDAMPGQCYDNVATACSMSGGSEVSGWLIWYWPGVMIEAEHHMVMRLTDGLVDVTPPPDKEERVLFLPDPSSPFDRLTRAIVPNRQKVLSSAKVAPKVQSMIDASSAMKALRGTTFGAMVPVSTQLVYSRELAFVKAKNDLLAALRSGSNRNDPCFCGNGTKYKKCHGAKD